MQRSKKSVSFVSLLLGLCLAASAAGNDRLRPESPPADPLPLGASGVDSAGIPPADAGDDSSAPFREQTIYIPFNKLREVFEKPGRGVFVPYEQFKKLWETARAKVPHPVVEKPPIGVLIREIESEAVVEREVVSVSSRLNLEVLGKGWHEAPLRLRHAAIRSARVNDQPARVLFDPDAGYKLLIESEDDEPHEITVELKYAKSFSKSPARNSVTFESPEAPVNRWQIRVPQPGVDVSIHPLVAASEAATGEESTAEDETVVLAFVGAAPTVRIDWTPKAKGATGLKALATVQSEQEMRIDEGVVRTRTNLQYDIRRAELTELEIQVPADQRVTGVFDANVREWKVRQDQDSDSQVITVQLFQPARGAQALSVELEKLLDESAGVLMVPTVQSRGVSRQHGIVVLRVGSELRAEVTQRTGLSQLDANELPPRLRNEDWNFAYRFSAVPFQLSMHVEPVTSRIYASQLVEAYLEPEQLTVEVIATIDVQRAGIFQLDFAIPRQYDVRSVRGQAVGNAAAAAVDTYHRDPNDEDRLTVDLARKAEGRVGIVIELQRTLDERGLSDPAAEAAELLLAVPRAVTDAISNQGHLVVYAPDSLRTIARTLDGVRNVSFDEAFSQLDSRRDNRFAALRPVLAYVYQAESASVLLETRIRKPQVSVRQLLTARVEPGVIKYTANFFYDVRFSGVRHLRIDVPAELSNELRNVTRGVQDAAMQPQPEDVAEGLIAWEFTGESAFLGNRQLTLQWESPSKELEVGGSLEFRVPQLRPHGADRAWGQVVLTKAESLDIHPSGPATGLRPIDPQHDLMAGSSVSDAARAFEFHDDWSLEVTAKRYDLEDIKRTSIERALLRMVVTRSNRISVQALYRMRSVTQGLAVQLPAGAEFDADPLRINGQAQPLKQGEDGTLFIPISETSDEAFLLELRYTVAGNHRRLDLPVFPAQQPVQSEPAVQKVFVAVYLPADLVRLGSFGPWTPHRTPTVFPTATVEHDGDLLSWVSEGIKPKNKNFQNFPTNGQLHTYTTLRPAPPPDGSLRLVAFSKRWLDAILFGGLGLLGVALVRRSAQMKVIALLGVLLALIVAGVFVPTFASQLLRPELMLALGAAVIIWIAVGVARTKIRWPSRIESPPPAHATAGAAVESVDGTAAASSGPVEPTDRDLKSDGGESHDA